MGDIFLIIDAGVEIGTGHLMEGLALAETFGKTFRSRSTFLVRDFQPACDLIRREGHGILKIPEGIPRDGEADWIREAVREKGIDLLVCDLLNRKDSFYGSLREPGVPLLVILDDGFLRGIDADIVVNFSILQDASFYGQFSGGTTRYCIGPEFMPLREELHRRWKQERPVRERCRKIFVNQGGSDPGGNTARIIRALELMNLDQEIAVVVGSAVPEGHRREILTLEKEAHNSYAIEWGVPPSRMGEIMEGSDLAITAPGNTIYELAIFGIPSLTVCLHEQHMAVAEAFVRRGAVINLGLGSRLTLGRIAEAVGSLIDAPGMRRDLARGMKGIVDGLGSGRIAGEVNSLWGRSG